MDLLLHAANLLLLLALSARGILLLRGLHIAASLLFLAFALLQPAPLWSSIGWNLVFGAINLRQGWLAILARRPPAFTAEEQRLQAHAFADLPLHPVRRLLDAGQWVEAAAAAALTTGGQPAVHLWLIADGHVDLRPLHGPARTLGPGDFLGDAAFLRHGPTSSDAVAVTPLRLLRWQAAELREACARDPALADVVQRALGRGLARALERPR